MPHVTGGRAGYAPMDTFPIEGDKIPDGYSGWLLFLDEFNSAPPSVQAAAYKLVLDRMVGGYPLHKNVAIVCAGNLETDNAIVQPMSTALQSRLVHLELAIDHKEWLEWAAKNDVHHMITAYVNFKPGSLYSFRADHSDKTYACPRTWAFADRILKVTTDGDMDRMVLLSGALSEGVAREFLGFIKQYDHLPKIDSLISSPESILVPQEPSVLFALAGAISHNVDEENFGQLAKFVKRMPIEFQVVCLRETMHRKAELVKHPTLQEWIRENASELF